MKEWMWFPFILAFTISLPFMICSCATCSGTGGYHDYNDDYRSRGR
jgi:hypothetical protein